MDAIELYSISSLHMKYTFSMKTMRSYVLSTIYSLFAPMPLVSSHVPCFFESRIYCKFKPGAVKKPVRTLVLFQSLAFIFTLSHVARIFLSFLNFPFHNPFPLQSVPKSWMRTADPLLAVNSAKH